MLGLKAEVFMNRDKETGLVQEASIEPIAVELACLLFKEDCRDDMDMWERTKAAVYWLMDAGLAPFQAIHVTTLAKMRLGL